MDLEPERFEHPSADGIRQGCDLTPARGESGDERRILADGPALPKLPDCVVLGLDLLFEIGDPLLYTQNEPPIEAVSHFQHLELA